VDEPSNSIPGFRKTPVRPCRDTGGAGHYFSPLSLGPIFEGVSSGNLVPGDVRTLM